jgi:hypothetical protein
LDCLIIACFSMCFLRVSRREPLYIQPRLGQGKDKLFLWDVLKCLLVLDLVLKWAVQALHWNSLSTPLTCILLSMFGRESPPFTCILLSILGRDWLACIHLKWCCEAYGQCLYCLLTPPGRGP